MPADDILVDTLVDRVSFQLTNSATPDSDLDREIRWAIQQSVLDALTRSGHWGIRCDGSIVTVAGDSDYALADDFHELLDQSVVFTTNTRMTLKFLPEHEFNVFQLGQASAAGRPTHYWVRSRDVDTGLATMRVWPTPTDVDTIAYRYKAVPRPIDTTLRGDGAVLDRRIPIEFCKTFVHGALTHFPRVLNNQDLQYNTAAYEQGVAKMKMKSSPVSGQTYQRRGFTGGRGGGGVGWHGAALTGPPA